MVLIRTMNNLLISGRYFFEPQRATELLCKKANPLIEIRVMISITNKKERLAMTIMVAIDMHVKSLVTAIGVGKEKPVIKKFTNDFPGYQKLNNEIEHLKHFHSAKEVLIVYEASGLGYVLHDILEEQGYRCAVLAPTELERSATGYKKKTDKKDAYYLYEKVRGHVLAGNDLHDIWIPDKELREDRDLVRTLFDLGKKITQVKVQIQSQLRKNGIKRPESIEESWSIGFYGWLDHDMEKRSVSYQISLKSLLRQLRSLQDEQKLIEKAVKDLAGKPRYKEICNRLLNINGVGLKTAMTFITEIGCMNRFSNRYQLGSYIGLAPSSFESGEADDRKGRITRNGPYRVRSILNQSVWAHLRFNGEEREIYDKIVKKNPRRKKKAVVACMRRLAIRMWHIAKDVELIQQAA